VLLVLDNFNLLLNSCESHSAQSAALDLVESFNEMLSYAQNDRKVSLVIGTNRDLFNPDPADLSLSFYREFKNHSTHF